MHSQRVPDGGIGTGTAVLNGLPRADRNGIPGVCETETVSPLKKAGI